jgi:lipopolysaccharide exporter
MRRPATRLRSLPCSGIAPKRWPSSGQTGRTQGNDPCAIPSAPLSDSILSKTARGAGWAIGWRVSRRILGLANTLILARLLVPDDFGLVALATGFSQGILAFSTLGIEEAVIREKSATRETYDTAFTINLIRGLATAAIVAVCAWPVAEFFKDQRLMPVLLALAGCGMITSFENIGIVEFRRDFAFEREFKLLLLPRLTAIAVTVGVALIWRSHWALVAGIATAQTLTTAMGYVMHPFRPRIGLTAWRQLVGFSVWSWGISVAIMLRDRVDGFVIGRMLGLAEVGVYAVGAEFGIMPTYELAAPLSAACFSGFAAAARSGAEIASTYLRILATVSLIVLPVGAGVTLVAGPLVVLAFGPRWAEAADIVRILGAAGSSVVLGTVSFALMSAGGMLGPAFAINTMSVVIRTAGAIVLVTLFGLRGAAMAYALSLLIENFSHLFVAFRRFHIRGLALLDKVWRGLLATAVMAGVLRGAHLGDDMASPVRSLIAGVLVGAIVYTLTLLGAWLACGRPEGAETDLAALVRRMVPRFRTA